MNNTIDNDVIETTDTTNNSTSRVEPAWSRQRGPLTRPDGRICIGRVGAPAQQEATSDKFFFWIPPDALVEKTQLITCESQIAGQQYTFYAIVEEVHRRSRKRDMGNEIDEGDGDLGYIPPFESEGYTYASASILRTEPAVFTPPRERSDVLLAGPAEAGIAYGADEIEPARALSVGLIKNGGDRLAGPGAIDLDYLLGINGGHMNVNGSAGRGTKSSFLLHTNWLLLHKSRQEQRETPSSRHRLRIVPIILNVKNFDLFHIDRWSSRYDSQQHLADWQALGIDDPVPFQNVTFYAAQQPQGDLSLPTGRHSGIKPYSWCLRDIIEKGLLQYLFAESDANDSNFGALVMDIESLLTDEQPANGGNVTRSLRNMDGLTANFQGLLDWVNAQIQANTLRNHHPGTWRKLHRRLLKIVYESGGVLRRYDQQGNPLDLCKTDTSDPIVIDLAALAGQPELQRFVVATIFRQLVEARTGSNAVNGLVYLITIDELNRFAPRGARDPITQLIETVAAEMRSQGIILLGAQQQASKVSEKIIENSAIRVMGKTGSLELGTNVWRFLSASARRKAESLLMNEKLVIQDNFREPMHVRVPFPVWAMNPDEARHDRSGNLPNSSTDNFSDLIDE
jgi:hypothetical protein